MDNLNTLGEILENIYDYQDDHALYLPADKMWSAETKGAVLDPMDVDDPEDDDEIPEFAKKNQLEYVFMIGDVQQIVENARLQLNNAQQNELVIAFKFYFENDAFIEF